MIFSNKTYDTLKWIALIALPAVTTFTGVIMEIWGMPYATEIVATLTAIDTLLGALIGVSSKAYYREVNSRYEGE